MNSVPAFASVSSVRHTPMPTSTADDVVHYSEPHTQTGHIAFSPDGAHLAVACGYRLVIRDVSSLQIVELYTCIDAIEGLEWSFDSEYVLCTLKKRGAAQVWSVRNAEWHCKIDEGPVGLAHACFSPDGRHVLATADFRLRITIWSLCDRNVYYIRFPKHADRGLAFTPEGTLMALAERTDGRDSVGIFELKGWKMIRSFPVASIDLEDICWSPNGMVLCIIDTVLQYQVHARRAMSYQAHLHLPLQQPRPLTQPTFNAHNRPRALHSPTSHLATHHTSYPGASLLRRR